MDQAVARAGLFVPKTRGGDQISQIGTAHLAIGPDRPEDVLAPQSGI